MKRSGYVLALGLALVTAYAVSQENPNPTQQGTPATTVQQQPHPAQPPTQDSTTSPNQNTTPTANPSTTPPEASGTEQSSAAASKGKKATANNSSSATASGGFFSNPQDAARLQQQIQNAIRNEPTLSGDNITVTVNDSDVDVGGNANSSKERLTARRIVQSFSGNRRVREHISVAGAPAPSASAAAGSVIAPAAKSQKQANKPITNPNKQEDVADRPR